MVAVGWKSKPSKCKRNPHIRPVGKIMQGTHEDERTVLFKTISLNGIKPNTNRKTNTNTNPIQWPTVLTEGYRRTMSAKSKVVYVTLWGTAILRYVGGRVSRDLFRLCLLLLVVLVCNKLPTVLWLAVLPWLWCSATWIVGYVLID